MPLSILQKVKGDPLTSSEFNELLGAVNDFVDSNYFITSAVVSDFDAEVGNNSSVTANTLKRSYPIADENKLGLISATLAVDLDVLSADVSANNAKVGISTQQAGEIAANTLKPVLGDFDTLAKLNAILTDATLVETTDARLSDARNPLAHVHTISDVTDLQTTLDGKSANGHTHTESDITDLKAYLLSGDLNTLAKLNAIVVDATLIDTADARLSNARTPLAHSHAISDVTDLQTNLDGKAASVHTHTEADITDLKNYLLATDLDTLAKLNALIVGSTLIETTDSRLSDARTPLAHTHTAANITDFDAEVNNNATVANNASHAATITGNPHAVTKADVGLGSVPNVDTTNASNITTGTLPSSVLPPIALVDVFTAANETAHLATDAQRGDVVVRTDQSKSYMHNGGVAGTMADFTLLESPTESVSSVNGQTGTIILNAGHIGATPSGDLTATDVQGIIAELETNKAAASHNHNASNINAGTFADARIAATNVTQHQAALSISESQISDLKAYLLAADLNTLAKLNAVLLDAVLIDTNDPRLSDSRTPTAHTHTEADITDLKAYLLSTDINSLAKVNAIIADATLIDTNDSRLSDARTPLGHTHAMADLSDFNITTPSNGQILQYNSASSKWENVADSGGGLQAADIDTLAELNAIITDATLIDTTDARLSDARTPTAHNHTVSEITDFDPADYARADGATPFTGDLSVSVAGSTNTVPRILGLTDFNATGDAARLQFGDAFNVVQAGYNRCMDIYSYNTFRLIAGSFGSAVPLPFAESIDDISILLESNYHTKKVVVRGAANQSVDIFQVRNNADATLLGVTNTGDLDLANGATKYMRVGDAWIRHNNSESTVISNNQAGTAGTIYLRPNGDQSTTGQTYFNAAGNMYSQGAIIQDAARTTTWLKVFQSFVADTNVNENVQWVFGKSASTRNSAEFTYMHAGDGLTSNKVRFGFYGVTNFEMLATGGTYFSGDITTSGTIDGRDVATDGTKLDGISSGAQVNEVAIEDTPTTEITLDNVVGRYSNMAAANATTAYTIAASPILGAKAKVLINAATEPTVANPDTSAATKIESPTFQANTDMYMHVEWVGATRKAEYFFTKITA